MKKLGLILLAIFLVVCSTSNDTTETIETTTSTTISQTESKLLIIRKMKMTQIKKLLKVMFMMAKKCHHLQALRFHLNYG